jgi:hypothetical protein
MFLSHRFWIGLCLALGLASFDPGPALAQDVADQDAAEISAYALAVAGLAKYRQANTNLAQLGGALSANCDEDEGDQSIDAMVAEIRGIPGAAEAIESAGMPVREYVVFTWAMVGAGFAAWTLDQPGGELPPDVSLANAEFARAHGSEFQEAASLVEPYDCDHGASDGDGDEGYEEGDHDDSGYEE